MMQPPQWIVRFCRLVWMSIVIVVFLPLSSNAQSALRVEATDGIREFQITLDEPGATVNILLPDLRADDVIYAYAEAPAAMPSLIVRRADVAQLLAESDNRAQASAVLAYSVSEAGTYRMTLRGDAAGTYQLTVGINRIDVLAQVSMNPAVTRDAPDTIRDAFVYDTGEGGVRTYRGAFEDSDDEVQVRLDDLSVGDTIYVTATGRDLVDPYLFVRDADTDAVLFEDDDGSEGFDSALLYDVSAAGDYLIELITIGDTGGYRLNVSVNDESVIVEDGVVGQALRTQAAPFSCEGIDLAKRPTLSSTMKTYERETFVIHYTTEGRDAATEDYIETMADAIQQSLDVQLGYLGWALPPPDCGEGGDDRIDIYVEDTSRDPFIGRARPETVVGDNPATPAVETYAAYGYLAIDNDMDMADNPAEAQALLKTTAAHEIHHVIQFGYDANEPYRGFYEAGATWVETLVFPELTKVFEDAGDVFNAPDICIGFDAGLYDVRVYGEWVMLDSMARDNGADSYRRLWEAMASGNGLTGFYTALEEMNTTPQEVIGRMAVRNLLLDYDNAENFRRQVRLDAIIDGQGFVSPQFDGVQELGVDYAQFALDGRYTLELLGDDALDLWAVGIDTGDDSAEVIRMGEGAGVIDSRQYDEFFIMVLNTRRHVDPYRCTYDDWTIRVTETPDAILTPSTGEVWNAANYISPYSES